MVVDSSLKYMPTRPSPLLRDWEFGRVLGQNALYADCTLCDQRKAHRAIWPIVIDVNLARVNVDPSSRLRLLTYLLDTWFIDQSVNFTESRV